ncbi:hypothetical protein TorRG33x02_302030, partial [Trema orientale]
WSKTENMQNFFLHIIDIGSKYSRQIFLQNFLHENMVMFDKGRGKLSSVFTIELTLKFIIPLKRKKSLTRTKRSITIFFLPLETAEPTLELSLTNSALQSPPNWIRT